MLMNKANVTMTNKLSRIPIVPMRMYMILTARLLMWARYSSKSPSADEDVTFLQTSLGNGVFSIAAKGV